MTQKLISNTLGVHRADMMEATAKLQQDGLIRYGNGNITVLDRAKLEHRVCECHGVVKHEIERLFAFELPAPARAKLKALS